MYLLASATVLEHTIRHVKVDNDDGIKILHIRHVRSLQPQLEVLDPAKARPTPEVANQQRADLELSGGKKTEEKKHSGVQNTDSCCAS